MNSDGVHHLYDRLTAKRIAEHSGVPLYVTSQTVGPHLLKFDREIVSEIADYARIFGAREESTANLLRLICSSPSRVVRTLDDAFLLPPSEDSLPASTEKSITSRYVVASFTFHSWSTALSREEYYQKLATIVDHICKNCDVDVVLLPHMGTLENPTSLEDDLAGHSRIEFHSKSGRVHASRMLSARDVVKLTAGSEFTISTRYHPVVFGPAVSVPAIGLITSYYSSIRMRGALKNVGLESLAIPFESWSSSFGSKLISSLTTGRERMVAHLNETRRIQTDFQSKWWDGIWADINQTGTPNYEDAPAPVPYEWATEMGQELLEIARTAQEGTNRDRLDRAFEMKNLKSRLATAEKKIREFPEPLDVRMGSLDELKNLASRTGGRKDNLRLFLFDSNEQISPASGSGRPTSRRAFELGAKIVAKLRQRVRMLEKTFRK